MKTSPRRICTDVFLIVLNKFAEKSYYYAAALVPLIMWVKLQQLILLCLCKTFPIKWALRIKNLQCSDDKWGISKVNVYPLCYSLYIKYKKIDMVLIVVRKPPFLFPSSREVSGQNNNRNPWSSEEIGFLLRDTSAGQMFSYSSSTFTHIITWNSFKSPTAAFLIAGGEQTAQVRWHQLGPRRRNRTWHCRTEK